MNITKRIKLDFARSTSPVVVWAKQGDNDSRYIEVEPYYNGLPYTIPSGVSAKFACRKPDGHNVFNDKPTIANNIITIPLTEQTLAAHGEAIATVGLYGNNGILSTQNFILRIEYNPAVDAEIESTDEYYNLLNAIEKVESLGGGAGGANGKSAYDIAVENGFEGSEEEWLESLRGEDGAPGVPGSPGIPGDAGAPGYTPVRGVDYWTAEDVAAIEADAQAYIADELAKRGQLAPEFANSIAECTDTAKLYVLPDGYVYAYMTTAGGANFKNLADPNSADWLTDKRLNSSHVETAAVGISVTNYLSVDGVSAFHLKGLDILSAHSSGENYGRIYVYDAGKNYLGYCQPSTKTAYFSAAAYDSSVRIVDWVGVKAFWFSSYNVAYVRFGGIPSGEVVITADEEITYAQSGAKVWQNTGHAFIPADYEDRITELETEVDAHTDSILSLETKMRDLESDAIAIPDYWQAAVDEVIAKIKAVQVGRNCLTFPFFSDNHQRNGYAGVLIAKVMSECNIPYCFYGGDSISSGYIASEEAMIGQDGLFDRMMKAIPNGRFCRAVGNHDGYWAVSADENHTYTREQIYDLFLREESIAQNKHFGGDGTYYYIEDRASKVRFVVLNTNGSVDEAQLAWLEEVALKFEESGWALVFISHQPITNNFHSNIANARQVQGILTAYINGASSNKADVIGWFSGHIHRDRIYRTDHTGATSADDTETVTLPWSTVTITSDHTEIAYDDATKHTVAEDDQSHAIDFVTVNRSTRTVNITRLGIGADRSYSY